MIAGVVTGSAGNDEEIENTKEIATTTEEPGTTASSTAGSTITGGEKKKTLKSRVQRRKINVAPWRWKVDMLRGLYQVAVAGVGYLL